MLPNPQPGRPVHNIYNPWCNVTQLYPQARGTHFGRLLLPEWATVGLFFSPVTARGKKSIQNLKLENGTNIVLTVIKSKILQTRLFCDLHVVNV